MERSSSGGRRRHYGQERERRRRHAEAGRPKYSERPGGLSPLRSPRAATLHNIMDLDNSRNHRFTNHLKGRSTTSPNQRTPQSESGKTKQETLQSNDKCTSPDMTTAILSDCEDTEETNSTPEYSRKSCRLDKSSWTRRRLELPSEDAEEDKDKSRLPTISEDTQVRLARREKDIAYGKNTDAYRMYVELIPRELRSSNLKKHPRTPKKNKQCSRRSWDSQVKLWKLRLHAWANEEAVCQDKNKCEGGAPQQNNSYASIVAHGHRSEEKDEQNSDDITGNSERDDFDENMENCSQDGQPEENDDEIDLEEDGESDPEDAEAFLDSADINFDVADQVEESVRLDDA